MALPSTSGRRSSCCSVFLILFSLADRSQVKPTEATCNTAQSTSCLQAAAGGNLDQLPGAGHCIVKQYVQYTHLCTVTNYLPTTDYCCCMFDARLLCCRYHQDWYHFRCMETEDELEINASDAAYAAGALDMPLLTLLPVILCPLVAVAICIICMTKCWCYRYDNDSSSSSSSSSSSEFYCCRCCKISDDKKEKIPRERFGGGGGHDDDDATAPLHQQPPSTSLSSAPEVHHPTSVPCLRALHPCCVSSSPRRFPVGLDGLAPVYHHCSTGSPLTSSSVRRVEPSAPSMTSAIDDDPYAIYFRRDCNSSLSDFQRMLPTPRDHSTSDPNGICLRTIQDNSADIYCACAPPCVVSGDVVDARCRCDVAVGQSMVTSHRLAHAHILCPDCLPPAYESIHEGSRAQL